jgi:hypothetical protein
MSLLDVTRISRVIAADYHPRLRVIGVASTDAESGRVELLVTIRGCHRDPCVIMLNVSRTAQGEFERELHDRFRHALASHVAPA